MKTFLIGITMRWYLYKMKNGLMPMNWVLTMVKMKSFMLCISYHNKNNLPPCSQTERKKSKYAKAKIKDRFRSKRWMQISDKGRESRYWLIHIVNSGFNLTAHCNHPDNLIMYWFLDLAPSNYDLIGLGLAWTVFLSWGWVVLWKWNLWIWVHSQN